jgi:hypothetical protein
MLDWEKFKPKRILELEKENTTLYDIFQGKTGGKTGGRFYVLPKETSYAIIFGEE